MLWPPAAWLARLASKRAWYSGVNGGCWAGPQRMLGSNTLPRPWPTPSVIALGPRRHWPFRSGYFVWSNAEAPAMVASSTDAAIEIRPNIAVLPAIYQPAHAYEQGARRRGTGVCPVSTHTKTMYHTWSIAFLGGVSKFRRTGVEHEAIDRRRRCDGGSSDDIARRDIARRVRLR